MKLYVCGFAFDSPWKDARVLLIRKLRPSWQKGRLNGIGGHIEDGELPIAAMIREFKEESGLEIFSWKQFCRYTGKSDNYIIHFFKAISVDITKAESKTDEQVEIHKANNLPTCPEEGVIGNLNWLIPLALDPWPNGIIDIRE